MSKKEKIPKWRRFEKGKERESKRLALQLLEQSGVARSIVFSFEHIFIVRILHILKFTEYFSKTKIHPIGTEFRSGIII